MGLEESELRFTTKGNQIITLRSLITFEEIIGLLSIVPFKKAEQINEECLHQEEKPGFTAQLVFRWPLFCALCIHQYPTKL